MRTGVVVLGATGSIGSQTLEVAEALGLPILGLAARTPRRRLIELAERHPEAQLVVTGGSGTERDDLTERLGSRVGYGTEALVELAATSDSIVVNGIVGAAGLRASVAALEAGNRLALANKESLVAGGPVVLRALELGSGELIPVDSEHSAVFQLVDGLWPGHLDEIVLTASGGPFRGWSAEDLAEVTPAQALQHPTWDMGPRITVDSATLANKGLEVIEAHLLFGVPYPRIKVVVHPQSAVHSLVRLTDGSLLAHVGATDMRIPIQYALTHPDRRSTRAAPFDLTAQPLTFEAPDWERFPALALAYRAGSEGGGAPAVFNAADEVAVEAFLAERIGFAAIPEVIERTLEAADTSEPTTVDEVLTLDREARAKATEIAGIGCG